MRRDQEQAADFLTTFTRLKKRGNRAGSEDTQGDDQYDAYAWQCRLSVNLPDPLTSRVDWGEIITGYPPQLRLNQSRKADGRSSTWNARPKAKKTAPQYKR